MKKSLWFLIAFVVLLSATAVTFARNTATTAVTINAAGFSGEAVDDLGGISTVASSVRLKYSTGGPVYVHHNPTWSPIVDHAGEITAGDLYYMNATAYTGDLMVTLYITNPYALTLDYSYLNMRVNVWSGTPGSWVQSTLADGTAIGERYLTPTNGSISFILNGGTHYCISVDSGSYYCIDTDAAGGSLTPQFYIEVQPL